MDNSVTNINKKIGDVLSSILNVQVEMGVMDEIAPKEFEKEKEKLLSQSILLWKDYFEEVKNLKDDYGIDLWQHTNSSFTAIELLIHALVPNVKARYLIEWWVYQKDVFKEEISLKVFDEKGKEIKVNTINQLMKIVNRLNNDPNYDVSLEAINFNALSNQNNENE
jgi:beta-galactosidase GanA